MHTNAPNVTFDDDGENNPSARENVVALPIDPVEHALAFARAQATHLVSLGGARRPRPATMPMTRREDLHARSKITPIADPITMRLSTCDAAIETLRAAVRAQARHAPSQPLQEQPEDHQVIPFRPRAATATAVALADRAEK